MELGKGKQITGRSGNARKEGDRLEKERERGEGKRVKLSLYPYTLLRATQPTLQMHVSR